MKRLAVLGIALLASAMPAAAWAQTASPAPTYEQPLSAKSVREVQARLHQLGYYNGPADGVWGAETRAALERFQGDRRLAVTGRLNQASVTALGLNPEHLLAHGYTPPPARHTVTRSNVGPETTRAVQRELRRDGLYHGPIDGVWGRDTRDAVAAFQRGHRLPATGEPSRETLAALGLNPESFMTGSTEPQTERLNRQQYERAGQR